MFPNVMIALKIYTYLMITNGERLVQEPFQNKNYLKIVIHLASSMSQNRLNSFDIKTTIIYNVLQKLDFKDRYLLLKFLKRLSHKN